MRMTRLLAAVLVATCSTLALASSAPTTSPVPPGSNNDSLLVAEAWQLGSPGDARADGTRACGAIIYNNLSGNVSNQFAAIPVGGRLADDCYLEGSERTICEVVSTLRNGNTSGPSAVVELELWSACPGAGGALLASSGPMPLPPNQNTTLTWTLSSPVTVHTYPIWFGVSDLSGTANIGPLITRAAEIGWTADQFYTTSCGAAGAVCNCWFGGNPYAGFSVSIEASGPAPCGVPCPPGSSIEGEPVCFPDYVDNFNGGCNSVPVVFSPGTCGATICGQAGLFLFGGALRRDTDWYEITISQPSVQVWSVRGELPMQASIIQPGAGVDCTGRVGLGTAYADLCADAVVTSDCLSPGTYWLFAAPVFLGGSLGCGRNYQATVTCLPCTSCGLTCNAGAAPEVEPVCGPNYVDSFNGGCNSVPEVFQPLPLGQTVCGQSGTFLNGATPTRDTDWFAVQLTQTSNLTASVAADFAASLFIVAPGSPTPCIGSSVLANVSGGGCETITATAPCLTPGTYWVVVVPLTFSGVPCGSSYLVQATATPCAPPFGVGLFTGGLDGGNILTPGDLNTGWSGPPFGGPWFQYPNGWWNEWWPNNFATLPMQIEIHVDAFMWSGGSVEIAANWSAITWNNPLRPPMPFEDHEVVRHSFGTFATCGSYVLTVTVPYCPLWVSVDVRGTQSNVQGRIEYGCSSPPPTGACCLPGGVCQPHTASGCGGLGGTWLGPGSSCFPNPCGGGGGPGCVYADPRIRTVYDPPGAGSGLSRSPEVDPLGRVTDTPGAGAGVDPADTSPATGTDGLAEPTGPRSPVTGTGTRSGSGVGTTASGSRQGPPGETVAGGPETRNPPADPPKKKKDCDPPVGGGSAQTSASPSYRSPARSGGALAAGRQACNAIDIGLGVGWNYATSVVYWDASAAQYVMLGRDSSFTTFRSTPRGGWMPSSGAHFDLTVTPEQITARHKHGTRFHFSLMEPAIPLPGPAYLLTAIEDRNGLLTTYTYEAGRLVQITDPYGRTLNFTHYPDGHIQSISDPLGRQLSFEYLGNDLTAINLPDGTRIEYTYDADHVMTSKRTPCNTVWQVVSTPTSRALVDPDGNAVVTVVNADGWQIDEPASMATGELRYIPGVTTIIDGNGQPWQYAYDAYGHITQITDPALQSISLTWDNTVREVIAATDRNGNTTQYQYDSRGNLVQITDALLHTTVMAYEPVHSHLVTLVEHDGDTWTYEYDSRGNLTRIVDPIVEVPVDATVRYEYDPLGQRIRAIDGNDHVVAFAYTDGLLTTRVVDPNGLAITQQYAYDAAGRLVQYTDPTGAVATYQYTPMRRLSQVTVDPGGPPHLNLTQSFAYDICGRLVQVTDPRGVVTLYQYDNRDRVVALIEDAGGLNRTTAWTHDGNGNRTTETDALGIVTTWMYDSRNRLIQVHRPTSTMSFVYDNESNQTQVIDGDGRIVQFIYDALDRPVARIVDPGGLSLVTTYDYAPSGCGCGTPGRTLLHAITDADGRVRYQYYDALDRLVKIVRKVGDTDDNGGDDDDAITTAEYDPAGNILRVTVANFPFADEVAEFAYDAANRQTSAVIGVGGPNLSRAFVYDAAGRVIQQTQPSGQVINFAYDAVGRRTLISHVGGTLVSQTFDATGNLLSATDGLGQGYTYEYDNLGRKIRETDGRGSSTFYTYDALDRLVQVLDRNGHATTYTYDAAGRRLSETTPVTAPFPTTTFTYDNRGNQLSRTDANGQTTAYFYDGAARLVQETLPDGGLRTYTYAGTNRPVSRVDQNGDTTLYTYDSLERLVQRSYALDPNSPAAPTPSDTFVWDRATRLRSAFNSVTTTGFAYDTAGRLVSSSDTLTGTNVGVAWTQGGGTWQRTVAYPSGTAVEYGYDRLDRLVRLRQDGVDLMTLAYQGPRLAQRTYPLINWTSTFGYDGNNWITTMQHLRAGVPQVSHQYGRDNEGKPTFVRRLHDIGNSDLYAYDAADRLIGYQRGQLNGPGNAMLALSTLVGPLNQQTWTDLDPLGNWLESESATAGSPLHTDRREVDDANGYTRADDRLLRHDRNGNLIIRSVKGDADGDGDIDINDLNAFAQAMAGPIIQVNLANLIFDFDDDGDVDEADFAQFHLAFRGSGVLAPGAVRYTYDVENRLRQVTIGGGATVTYRYDAINRRIERQEGSAVTRYVHDEQRVIEERNLAGALIARHVYGNYIDDIVATEQFGQRRYYFRDAVGSTVALASAAGTVVERYLYDPYGRPTVTDAAGVVRPAGSAFGITSLFTGRRWDATTRLYDYRTRTYDPVLGRFISRDIAGYIDGDNLYQYCRSQPSALTDPLGMACNFKACTGVNIKPWEISKKGKLGPIEWNLSISVKINAETCRVCCPEGTPKECQWVTDATLSISIVAEASASASSYGGSVGPFSYWAGIKLTLSLEGRASGSVASDRCNGKEGCASICLTATASISISGGANVSLETWWRTYQLGADITGTGSATLKKCWECCPATGCTPQPGTLCFSASIDLNVHAWVISGTWNIWKGEKCFGA